MTEREILIANSKDQSKYRIITAAITLGELQDALARNENVYKMVGESWISNPTPVNFEGLSFTEGLSKTQLLNRDSLLPTNVPFRGQTTNNLVMLLTNTNKQIASGAMDRKEVYRKVKELNLQEAINEGEGINWTRCKTDILEGYINLALRESAPRETTTTNTLGEFSVKVMPAPHAGMVEWFYGGIKNMVDENALNIYDVAALAELINEFYNRLKETTSVITASDLDDMLKGLM